MQGARHIIITLFPAVLSLGAGAHPHSFIHLETEIVSENDQFVVLKMRWTMDEIASADLLYDTRSTKLGDGIWKKLAAEMMANVLRQHYFTEMWHDGKKVEFKNRPTEYGVAQKEHRVVLTFALPLAEAQPLSGQKYTTLTFDPTHYADMSHGKDSDARLGQAINRKCQTSVHTPTPNE